MRLAALLPLLALTACAPGFGSRVDPDNPYAPTAVDRSREAVDGLTVGHRLMDAGEYELALKAYLRAGAEQGIGVDVLSALGSVNLRLGRFGQAEDLLRRAVAEDETFVPAWNNLGVVLMEQGRIAEASRVFRVAYATDDGKSESVRRNLALALAKLESSSYPDPDNTNFALVRRGPGSFLILAKP